MKKSKAIIILLCALLVLLGVGYVDLYGVDAEGTASASDISLGLDLAGGVSITYQVVGDEEPDATDMADTIAKLQKRVENYSKEAIVYQEGTDRINIEIPGVTDANKILEELGRPGSLYFIAETDKDGNANYSMQAVTDAQGNVSYAYALNKTIDELKADGSIMLEGTDVKTATAGSIKDQTMGNSTYAVDLVMTEEGTKKFEEATRNAYEKGETLGIYYDGSFVSVPSVKGVFSDGNAQISPMNSYEEAESLASTIRIGGLKLELEELHSKVVGAQLGVEAISTSLKAAVIGFIVVAVFMIAVYFLPGFASVIALGIYVALVVLLLNGFDLTLTLSGIAGIILSIGMAVDANVIVFARIREELATGKTVKSAMQIGYDKALSAIIDGNVTTLIAAAVLWLLGPGTVKGFAQTLALGIVLSMFTALVVTKYIMKAFYALGLKDPKWYGVGKEHKTVNFLGKKGIFFGLSLAVIAVGFITMGVYKMNTGDALNYSLEFKGGTATTVTFDKSYTLEEINSEMVPLIESTTGSAVQIQTVQGSNEVIFKTGSLDVDGREIAVWKLLLRNHIYMGKSKLFHHTACRDIARAVKRCIHDRDLILHAVNRALIDYLCLDLCNIFVLDRCTDDLVESFCLCLLCSHRLNGGKIGDRHNFLSHALVMRRCKLCAVLPVNLVAVVLRRVVAGGDVDTGDTAQLAHCEGQLRGGTQGLEQAHGDAVARHDTGGLPAFTIKTLRLPRMLAAIFCGAAFGLAGNTFQKLLGNPLASPDIIGVTSGASVAAVFGILVLKWNGNIVSILAVLSGLFVSCPSDTAL